MIRFRMVLGIHSFLHTYVYIYIYIPVTASAHEGWPVPVPPCAETAEPNAKFAPVVRSRQCALPLGHCFFLMIN